MKRFFFLLSLLISFSVGQIWADDPAPAGTTLISENFTSYSANDVPSGSVTTTTGRVVYGGGNVNYSCTASGTKIYNENTGGGKAPEILIAKNGGTFVIAGIPSGGAKAITVSFTQNNQALSVEPSGTGYSGSVSGKPGAVGTRTFDITVADGAAATFTLVFTGSGSSNVRVDDILITVKTAGEGGGTPTCVTPTFSPAAGSYEGTQNVTITSTTGATIYYTTDGSNPTTSGTKQTYSSPIAVSADMTIKAYATLANYDDSEVATAAYTITEGPDVTLNLIDGNWGFPTSNATGTETYTNSETGYSVTCYAPTNYKVSGSSYFYLGKSGAYIELPSFSSPIEKIVVTGNSGASTGVIWNIFKGDDAVSTAATGCAESSYTFNIDPEEANVTYTLKVTSAHNLQIKAIKIFFGTAPAVAKPTISGDENFVTSTTVTLSHADADHIYYTTNGDAPTTSSAEYATPFSLTNTATVKAIAVKGSEVSAVAEKTFTKVEALESMAALLEATTSTETAFNVVISNWVVTGVNGSRAWIADAANEKGILLYKSGHGFVAGNKLNGVVVGTKSKLYQGYPELTTLVSTDVTVTTATAITPRTTTIAALTSGYNAEQGTVVKLEGVTYSSSVLSDGVNSIAADNKLFSSLALIEGTTYDITGVVEYEDNSVIKIMPRSADDVEAQTPVVIPTAANLASLKAAARGTYILTLSNAVVSYVNGNNAFIEDATGGALIYFASHGYSAGDCLNGDYQVTTTDYQGKFEITAMEAQTGAAKTTAEIPLTTVSIATLNANFASYESRRIKIVGANVTDAISGSDRNGAINDGASLAVYAAVSNKITLTADDNVDIIGYPGYNNANQQLTVWAQADITVNEKEDPELAYNPAVVNVLLSDLASFTPADLEYATGFDGLAAITYESSDPSIATVGETTGVVEVVATAEGSATITASFPGNATYKVDNASYTINVSATIDTRHVANSPAEFTTVSGDMAPNDITFASYQGGAGTAPQNYNNGIRLYQAPSASAIGGYITLTAKAGCTIDEVQITTTSTYATTVTYSVDGNETLLKSESVAKSGSYTTGTGLNVQSVNIVNKGTSSSGRLEIASIKVYYTGEPASIHHYVLGGTYQTAFMQGDEFNHTGLIVYAAYDELEETKVDITSMCTFSEPDMNTTGDKTIEITYNEAVVTSYTINVATDSRKVANSPATFTTISGDMTPNDITFASYQGDAGTAPQNYNDGIRLYQAPSADKIGGYITLKAKKGCTIDQVKITTTNSYATTVAYSVDGNENLLGSESVAKSSDYSTPSGLNVESVNIVNKGTSSSGRLEIASIKVWYTGDALAVHHYILGGTYETVFEQFGTFSYEGLTVTAAYDAGATITEAVTGFTVEADLSTAGAKKANVMLNSVKIAEYDITVNASAKTDPALEYSPASVILTLGDALSAPTFSNTHNVSPITYSSDKPAVATVDAEGNISLAGGTGVAVITASFAGDDDYIESEATFTITVNEPAEDLSGTWVLATSVAAGDKIIIGATYQDATKSMGAQNGNNRLAVASTLDAGVLSPGEGTKVFTLVDAGDGKFAIQALNGNYLSAAGTGTSNYLKEAADYTADNAKWSISIDGEGVASVVALSENRNAMQYNSGSTLFSCYASVTSQRPINIYKKSAQPEPELTYEALRPGLEQGRFYSACVANNIIGVQDGILWDISYYEGSKVYFEEIVVSPTAPLAAGKPFICYTTSNDFKVAYGDQSVLAPVVDENSALRGTFSDMDQDAFNTVSTANGGSAIYIISNNQLRQVAGREGNSLAANRAYLIFNKLTEGQPNPAPGRRVMTMTVGENVATDIDFCNGETINASKIIRNGQILIIRDGKTFDVTGREMK